MQPGEDNDLAAERSRLSNSERLSAICDSLYALLIEGADDDGPRAVDDGRQSRRVQAAGSPARDSLSNASGLLAELVRLDPSMEPHEQTLAAIYDSVEELGRTLRTYRETVEHDPARLLEIEERLSLIHELKRKYAPNIDEIIAFGERAAQELDTLTHSEERIAALQKEAQDLAEEIGEVSAAMSANWPGSSRAPVESSRTLDEGPANGVGALQGGSHPDAGQGRCAVAGQGRAMGLFRQGHRQCRVFAVA